MKMLFFYQLSTGPLLYIRIRSEGSGKSKGRKVKSEILTWIPFNVVLRRVKPEGMDVGGDWLGKNGVLASQRDPVNSTLWETRLLAKIKQIRRPEIDL